MAACTDDHKILETFDNRPNRIPDKNRGVITGQEALGISLETKTQDKYH